MSFLTPLFLFLGLLAVPIILLYMLRLRRREMIVSSTMLWHHLLRDRQANAPWQRLRRNLLLLLQLLILAAMVLALARPFLPVTTVVSGSVVVLLDGSASMMATDVEPDRFSQAKDEVSKLIGQLDGNDQMTLILVGGTPTLLVSATSDKSLLRQALEDAQPALSAVDWPAALALASGATQGFEEAKIVIVSDGGLTGDLPPLPAEAAYIPIGESGENLSLSALATRDSEAGPQLFANVTNYGDVDRQTLISINLDERLFDSRRIMVRAGESESLIWELPEGTAVVSGRLSENEEDYLATDDSAWAVHEGGVLTRALIVTEGNRFLETAFSVLPSVETFRAGPDSDLVGEGTESFDLYVLDGVPLPDTLPAGDLLIINPQAQPSELASDTDSFMRVTDVFSNTEVIRLADDPRLQFVDWGGIHVRQAQAVEAPWAEPLVAAEGGPLLLVGEHDGRRIAILTFRLQDSDLPLQIAFPVLMANITGWLSPGRAFGSPVGIQPADTVALLPGSTTSTIAVRKADGTLWTEPVGEGSIVFSDTAVPGLYQVFLRDRDGEQAAGSFAVNFFNPNESSLVPANTIRIGQAEVESSDEDDVGQRELWSWIAAAAFAMLLVEWWVYHRGTGFPRLPNRRILVERTGRR